MKNKKYAKKTLWVKYTKFSSLYLTSIFLLYSKNRINFRLMVKSFFMIIFYISKHKPDKRKFNLSKINHINIFDLNHIIW